MRKYFSVGLFLFLGLVVSPTWALEGSFAIQGGAVQAFGGPASQPSLGVNGFAYMDFKIVPGLSLGVATSFSSLIQGSDRLYVDGTHLIGRLEPFGHSSWTPYFMLGAGLRPFYDAQPDHRWLAGGDFQGLAGIGLRHNLVKGMDLDVSVFYNLNPATSESLSSAGVRAGLAFPFGGDDSQVSASASESHSKTVVSDLDTQGNDSYKVHKGDSLWTISKHNAKAGHEWKKIYDANHQVIKDPNLIYPSQEIAIPSPGKSAE